MNIPVPTIIWNHHLLQKESQMSKLQSATTAQSTGDLFSQAECSLESSINYKWLVVTLPTTNTAPENKGLPKWKGLSPNMQFFGGYVSFTNGKKAVVYYIYLLSVQKRIPS